MIYSRCGVAEEGCVFATPNDTATETIWLVTQYDPAGFAIAFAWIEPDLIATRLTISLAPLDGGRTSARISYAYTGISPAGNELLQRYTLEWFEKKMRGWETAINHFLRHGSLIEA